MLAIGDPVRRDRRQLLGPRLHLADPAVPAHPDRHRPGRDRPQLPGRDRRRRRRRARRAARSPTAARRAASAAASPARRCASRSAPPGRRCSTAAPSAAAATSSRCAPSGSSPTCASALPPDAILVTDVGWNKNGVAQCYPLPRRGPVHHPRRRLHHGLRPGRRGRRAARRPGPGRWSRSVGDGGMSAQLPAVPMAVEQGLPVIFLVMNNRAHGTIADLQAANFGRSYGCEFRDPDGRPYSPDFAAFGRACGADGYHIERAGRPARRAAYGASGAADRRCWTCRWSTSRCRHPGTGTSRTSTTVSSSEHPCTLRHPDCTPASTEVMCTCPAPRSGRVGAALLALALALTACTTPGEHRRHQPTQHRRADQDRPGRRPERPAQLARRLGAQGRQARRRRVEQGRRHQRPADRARRLRRPGRPDGRHQPGPEDRQRGLRRDDRHRRERGDDRDGARSCSRPRSRTSPPASRPAWSPSRARSCSSTARPAPPTTRRWPSTWWTPRASRHRDDHQQRLVRQGRARRVPQGRCRPAASRRSPTRSSRPTRRSSAPR